MIANELSEISWSYGKLQVYEVTRANGADVLPAGEKKQNKKMQATPTMLLKTNSWQNDTFCLAMMLMKTGPLSVHSHDVIENKGCQRNLAKACNTMLMKTGRLSLYCHDVIENKDC